MAVPRDKQPDLTVLYEESAELFSYLNSSCSAISGIAGNKNEGIQTDGKGKKNGKNGKKTGVYKTQKQHLFIALIKTYTMITPVLILNFFIIVTLTILIITLFKTSKNRQLIKSMPYYLIAGIILFTFVNFRFLNTIFPNQSIAVRIIFEFYNCIFCFLELYFFIEFFLKHQPIKKENKALIKIPVLYLLLICIYLFYILSFQTSEKTKINLSVFLNIIEYIIILSICLIFYYSILINKIEYEPVDKHVLLIISSFFVYISVSLPFLIITDKIKKTNSELYQAMFFVHYLAIFVVFLTITYTLKTNKKLYYA